MPSEHDNFFKTIQQVKENAIDLIQGILPKEILERIDLNKFELDKESYITEDLKKFYTDLVYRTKYKDRDIRVAILFEHKSFKPDNEYLQLLRYILNIWEYENKNRLSLSIVVPVIFYHGRKEWRKRNFCEYFGDIDIDFKKFVPDFDYVLADLSKYDDNKIKNELFRRDINKAFSLLLKYIFNLSELRKHLPNIFEIIKPYIEQEEKRHYFISIIWYLFNTSDIKVDEIKSIVEKISKTGGEIIMTTAMKLREEGIKEGRIEGLKEGELKGKIEGLKEGELKGKIEGKQNSLIRQMIKKFGLTKQEIKLIQSCNDMDKLDQALEEILFANTKEEVLKNLK